MSCDPIAILSAVFCVICSLLMFVSDASGDHNVLKYGSCYGFVCLGSRVSPSIFGLRVSPSIFGLMFMGSVVLSICCSSCVLYSDVGLV